MPGIMSEDARISSCRCSQSKKAAKSKSIIGVGFGLSRYSSVSSVIMRVKSKLQKDKKFKERLARVESNIQKGQT